MPRVGSNQVDERAIRMIHDWIAGMPAQREGPCRGARGHRRPRTAPRSSRSARPIAVAGRRASAAIQRLASSTRGALMLLGLIDRDPASDSLQREVVAIIAGKARRSRSATCSSDSSPRGAGQAAGRRGRPAGDPGAPRRRRRGRVVFTANPAAQCKSCHKAGEVGETVGPDLTKIGAKYDRAALLDQILEPSKTIDPQSSPTAGDQGRPGPDRPGRGEEGPKSCSRTLRARRSASRRGSRAARAPVALAHAGAVAPRPDGAAGGRLAGIPDDPR